MATFYKNIRLCNYCGGRPVLVGSPALGGVLRCCCNKACKEWHSRYNPSTNEWVSSWNRWVGKQEKK